MRKPSQFLSEWDKLIDGISILLLEFQAQKLEIARLRQDVNNLRADLGKKPLRAEPSKTEDLEAQWARQFGMTTEQARDVDWDRVG